MAQGEMAQEEKDRPYHSSYRSFQNRPCPCPYRRDRMDRPYRSCRNRPYPCQICRLVETEWEVMAQEEMALEEKVREEKVRRSCRNHLYPCRMDLRDLKD